MRRLWNEFKSFAMSGNMLDLALGFIIGAAFAKIIDSMVGNVLMQLVAVIFGQPDFKGLTIDVNGGQIFYGAFLTDLVNFVLLTALLFGVVKFIVFIGVGRGRPMTTKQCPYCHEDVHAHALICRFCHSPLVDDMPDLSGAQTRLAELTKRRLVLPIPGRRKAAPQELP
jgi:large conductance mechanosensitive channel